jgi:hypothetical protein
MQIFLIKQPMQKSSTDTPPTYTFKVEREDTMYIVILQPDQRTVDVYIGHDVPHGSPSREFWPVGLHDMYAVAVNAVNSVREHR